MHCVTCIKLLKLERFIPLQLYMDVMDVLNFSSFSWLAFSSAHLCDVCFLWSWQRFASFVGSIRFYGILGQAISAHCAHSLLYLLHSVQFLILYSVKLERITYGKWSTSRAHYSSEPSIFAKFIYYEINTMYFTLSEPSYGGRAVAAYQTAHIWFTVVVFHIHP